MIGAQLVLWLSFLVRGVKIFLFMRHLKGVDHINKFHFYYQRLRYRLGYCLDESDRKDMNEQV